MDAERTAAALRGRKVGSGWMARCPAHDDRTPSLSIRDGADGKVLVRCHAGCDQERVIVTLRARGLWMEKPWRSLSHPARPVVRPHRPDHIDATRTEAALATWQSTKLADATLVENYLASRGLSGSRPATLRFHPGLQHPSGGIWPVMVALVTRGPDDAPLAIHRTFLARDGNGKAPVEPSKMMLGPCRGGAVRLSTSGSVLMVGEGIETCLAAMLATGHPTWAALSTSGLRALELPNHVKEVVVLADGDDAGEAAARACAARWKREGRRVRIARPPQGMDFNDLLAGGAPRVKDGAR